MPVAAGAPKCRSRKECRFDSDRPHQLLSFMRKKTREQISAHMRRIRKKDTKPELVVRRLLTRWVIATGFNAISRIAGDKDYQDQFMQAFGRDVNEQDMLRAIATYEQTLVSFDSPFDHFIAGDKNAISDSAKRGWELFNTKARCNLCHALTDKQRDVTVFTDNEFHNIGIGIIRHHVVPLAQQGERELAQGSLQAIDDAAVESEISVLGRFLITKKKSDLASFKTPDIRNILVTGPYFHDGSMQTLWDIADHYNKGDGVTDPWLDDDMQPLALTEPEINDLVAFLASLTSPQYKELGDKEYARQLALSKVSRSQRDTARAFGPKPTQPKPPPF
jgi:cytochrome c peroxidase